SLGGWDMGRRSVLICPPGRETRTRTFGLRAARAVHMAGEEDMTATRAADTVRTASSTKQASLMLAMATVGFAVNFWAWALLSPLGPKFKETLHLSAFQQALLVAVPVVIGSLGRIPVGALTDRFGGRVMFPIVSLATIVPVLFIGLVGHSSLGALLIGGVFLRLPRPPLRVRVPSPDAA